MHIRGLTCWLQRHVHGLYGQKWGRCLIQPIQLMKNDVQQNPLIEKTVLVTVPFWVYWTSPYSSHYRPYT